MAWRIDKSIVRGEIDNTQRGRVTGELWVLGRKEPVILDLQGDAWPDVAGTRLTFVNPDPKPQFIKDGFRNHQSGQVGDITASRKTLDSEHLEMEDGAAPELPKTLRNTLYLEWYDLVNGRVLIESSGFEITITAAEWELDEDEHEAQQMLNLQAMRDYLATVIKRTDKAPGNKDKWPDEMSEDEWEEGLKASDRLMDASMEATEKFRDDPDSDNKAAFVMGWDHLRDLEDEDERSWLDEMGETVKEFGEDEDSEAWKNADDDEGITVNTDDIDIDEDFNFERDQHPLQKRAQEYVSRVIEVLKEQGVSDRGESPDHPADVFCTNVFQIMGKLGGVLHTGPMQMPKGMILATMKRCLNWANEALTALAQLEALHPGESARKAFAGLRDELFAIREGITEVRRELQQEG